MGSSIEIARNITDAVGIPWESSFDSTSTPSGGGGTITVSGLLAIRDAVGLLLDDEDGRENSLPVLGDFETLVTWNLRAGDTIARTELHNLYGGIRQGGISPSRRSPNIFLFTDAKSNQEHGYEDDYWISDSEFIYCGQGQRGDQSLTGRNAQVLQHRQDGRALRLFQGVRGVVRYVGQFEISKDRPYAIMGKGRDNESREVVMFRLIKVDPQLPEGTVKDDLEIGIEYQFVSEEPRDIAAGVPFAIDPDLLDRATQEHSATQNATAQWLMSHGLKPLSPRPQIHRSISPGGLRIGYSLLKLRALTLRMKCTKFDWVLGRCLIIRVNLTRRHC